MKTDEIVDAARACVGKIRDACEAMTVEVPPAKRLDDLTRIPWRAADGLGHLLFMCDEIERLAAIPAMVGFGSDYSMRREKAMRWLGFVQGTLWGWGIATIEELKQMNAPPASAEEGTP